MKILILGGTSFLGPHQIAYALQRGHQITTFTRGKTRPNIHGKLFDQVESLIGDRADNLRALENRKWDVVIDNSGHKSQWTKDTANLLQDNVENYVYISSTGVYYPYLSEDITESNSLVQQVPDRIDDIQKLEYGYGVMKTLSEQEAKKVYGEGRSLILRPTYMIGPGDRTDRFTYWPARLSLGGQIVVPGKHNDPIQYIDVRDVAEWIIRLIEKKTSGTFNVVGPISQTGMDAFVHGAHAAFSSAVNYIKISDYDLLKKYNVLDAIPWIMPIENNFGSAKINFDLAIENGLSLRPLAESIRSIHEWWNSGVISKERMEKLVGPESLKGKESKLISEWKMNK